MTRRHLHFHLPQSLFPLPPILYPFSPLLPRILNSPSYAPVPIFPSPTPSTPPQACYVMLYIVSLYSTSEILFKIGTRHSQFTVCHRVILIVSATWLQYNFHGDIVIVAYRLLSLICGGLSSFHFPPLAFHLISANLSNAYLSIWLSLPLRLYLPLFLVPICLALPLRLYLPIFLVPICLFD